MRNINICIEGVIGCGKSTLLKEIEIYCNELLKTNDIICMKEPIEEWINTNNSSNENLFQLYMTNRKRWSFTFQINAIVSKIKQLKNIKEVNKIILSERSIYTDYHIFSKLAYDNKDMDDIEWKVYQEYVTQVEEDEIIKPHGYIYIQTNPKTCYDRIKKRNRNSEENINYDYILKLHQKHEDWLVDNEKNPVLIVSGEPNYYQDIELKYKLIIQIMEFIYNIQVDEKSEDNNIKNVMYQYNR